MSKIKDATVQQVMLSVQEFCRSHSISRSLFYKLVKEGCGPRLSKCRGRTLISQEAAAEWREGLETRVVGANGEMMSVEEFGEKYAIPPHVLDEMKVSDLGPEFVMLGGTLWIDRCDAEDWWQHCPMGKAAATPAAPPFTKGETHLRVIEGGAK